jgi:glucosylceramidase
VDSGKQYQEIDGFGASFSDSSAWLIWNKLSSAQQKSLMQQLFSTKDGIGLSFLRQPMGATDFSASGNYSFDDMPSGQTDPNLNNFSIAHDSAYVIPLLQKALVINPAIKIVALPWSPPAWMKTTGTMNGGNIDPSTAFPLTVLLVKFVQAYKQTGIPIYAIGAERAGAWREVTAHRLLPCPEDEVLIADFPAPTIQPRT